MDDINRLLGKLEEHMDNAKTYQTKTDKVLTRIDDKLDASHKRIDKVESDIKSAKAKLTGFAAAIAAVWSIVMHYVGGK